MSRILTERKFKEIAAAYEVLSNPTARAEYDKTGSAPSSSTGLGIGGDIAVPLGKIGVLEKDFASENPNLFNHSGGCEGKGEKDLFIHAMEAEDFRNHALGIINNYVSELNNFKEEVIRRIEAYAEKLKYLRNSVTFGSKTQVTIFENNMKKYIDDLKNSDIKNKSGNDNHNDLRQLIIQTENEISTKLNTAGVSDSDLDSSLWSPYNFWQKKLHSSNQTSEVNDFKNKMFAAIDEAQQKKNNQNGTGPN
ncbi:31483_t:CDS:2, partial [Racocetra persica]